jgi:pantoate--beta-alanine ligase
VVSRLFYIVKPDRAYFGEKDWQQIAVVKAMVRQLAIPVQIVECDIVRDEDGLAKSSRNTLLTKEERAIAPNIYKALKSSLTYAKTHTVQETHDKVVNEINAIDGLEVEYFSIVDGNTLQDIASWDDTPYVVGCITVYCGKTPIRLIDHIKYKES